MIGVDGGPGERVPEFDARILHGDQCRGLGGNQVREVQPEHRCGTGKHRHLAAVEGRCEDESVASALRERPGAQEVNAGDAGPGGERRAGRQVGQHLSLLAKLKKRKRVPAGVVMKAVREVLADRLVPLAPQQLSCRGPVQAFEPQGRQVGAVEQRRLSGAHGEDDSDRIGDKAAEREEQGVCARPVQPVGVVHQYRYRGLICIGGEQAEGGGAHGEAALGAGRPERERALQRRRLRAWDLVDPGQRRPQQLE